MHALLIALGTKGDLFPFLGFGTALAYQGYRVSIVTTGEFRKDVLAAGLDYVEFLSAQEVENLFKKRGGLRLLSQLSNFLPDLLRRLYTTVEETVGNEKAIICSTHFASFGVAQAAAEKMNLPWVTIWHNPLALQIRSPLFSPPFDRFERVIKRKLGQLMSPGLVDLRRSVGLSSQGSSLDYSNLLNIALFPAWILPSRRQRLPNLVHTGFPLYESGQRAALPEELADFLCQGDAPVVFYPGSLATLTRAYFQSCARACDTLGLRAVFLSRGTEISRKLYDPLKLAVYPYAPLASLLPRSIAVVHHGGIGTTARAFAEGVPQIVVPEGLDQPSNARLVAKLGVGAVIKPRNYSREITDSLKSVLSSESMRGRCKEVAARFVGQPDYSLAIERLGALV